MASKKYFLVSFVAVLVIIIGFSVYNNRKCTALIGATKAMNQSKGIVSADVSDKVLRDFWEDHKTCRICIANGDVPAEYKKK